MFISHLPLADLDAIKTNFQNVGLQTGFTLKQFLAQCVAVTVLFIVLNKFAWNPVRTILEERRKKIEQSMANADKIKAELADAEAARIKVLHKANDQAATIIAEAQKAGAALSERLSKDATAQAQDIVRRAHEASVLDRDKLMAELKQHVGELVIQTTQKVAGKVLTDDDQTRLNTETIRQINAPNN